jgi:NAD(P)-dependent dehydrogenase (short-subunit alcohol dehydrogenase family)
MNSLFDKKPLVWFITGTSQGFGRELVRAALQRGDSVVATSRQPEIVAAAFPDASDRLLAVTLDLHDPAQIARTVATVVSRFGRIDVLINNAGHGLLGAVEEASDAAIRRVYETNVFGLIRLTQAVLPHLRQQHSGHVVNLSSIGGLVGLPGWGIYNSTKFAVEGLSEALAIELAPLGIGVTIVEPGAPSARISSAVHCRSPNVFCPTTSRRRARRVKPPRSGIKISPALRRSRPMRSSKPLLLRIHRCTFRSELLPSSGPAKSSIKCARNLPSGARSR